MNRCPALPSLLIRFTNVIRASVFSPRAIITVIAVWALSAQAVAYEDSSIDPQDQPQSQPQEQTISAPKACERSRYTFSWPYLEGCDMEPRGGTTVGTKVTVDPQPHPGWVSLQQEGLSKFERDRRAILAMAGPYRASFEFLEVAGYLPDFVPGKPYQSWTTEYVYVLEDQRDFISLQHIMVMFFVGSQGEVSDPIVMKHWRQDWQYQKEQVLAYTGGDTWSPQSVPEAQRKGSWSQAVYQVDDSPRYEAWGVWEHLDSFSTWESATTWRPLPRREYSVRDDYDFLEGTNRHSILQTGWLHEEVNYKISLDEDTGARRYHAKELGVNRYDRIVDHDFSAGDNYLSATAAYWADVRAVWAEVLQGEKPVSINASVEGTPLFVALFGEAQSVYEAGDYVSESGRERIRSIIQTYLKRR